MTTSEDRAEWERELYVPSDFAATRPHSDAQPRSGVGTSPSTPEASAGVHGAEGAREAAEAERDRLREAVRRVEALLACQSTGCPCGGDRASVPSRALRAVLADAAPDPTPNTGEWVCSTCGQPMDAPPCSKSGSVSGHTVAGGRPAASSVDDNGTGE